jgi:protein phosphatase
MMETRLLCVDPSQPVAILADIHGNFAALDAVLADVAAQRLQTIILAGDLFINGPRPAEVLARLTALDLPAILGNTDEDVLQGDWPASVWAREQVGPAGLAYIRGLSPALRVSPAGGSTVEQDLLLVHATPRSVNDVLILEPQAHTTFDTPTPEKEALEMLAGERAGLIVYGHIHYFSSGRVGGQRLCSIGSVGFPFDGDTRAAYALAEWDGAKWSITPRRVAYDCAQAAQDIENSGQPMAWRYSRMLREACWLPAA